MRFLEVEPTDAAHRVTTIELLFDLVFVFAITNVTSLMEHHLSGEGVLEGLIALAVVWFGWCSYAWLGNQARADRGVLRLAMVLVMAAMFFVAISIPFAFDDSGNARFVLVVAYALVRLIHLGVYLIAAGDDTQLRSVILSMLGVSVAMLALLAIGAGRSGDAQRVWWLAAVVVDQLGVYFVRSTRWRLPSPAHFAERFGLIVIIAIGESVVAVGAASSSADLSGRDAIALVCGLAIAVCVWWLYFDGAAERGEQAMSSASEVERVRIARDAYTYVHFVIVSGIVFVALGLVILISDEGHVDAGHHALFAGLACYLVGNCMFCWRNAGSADASLLVLAALLLVAIPVLSGADSLARVVAPAVLMTLLVGYRCRRSSSVTTMVPGSDGARSF